MTYPQFVKNCKDFDICKMLKKHCNKTQHYAIFIPHREKIPTIGKKIVMGINSHVLRYNQHSTHAEVAALEKLHSVLKIYFSDKSHKFDLYVVRISKEGYYGSSRPCYHCLVRLIKSGVNIRDVYYSTDDRTIVKEKFTLMLHSPLTNVSSGYRRDKRPRRCKRFN